jgi:hypothetical protein
MLPAQLFFVLHCALWMPSPYPPLLLRSGQALRKVREARGTRPFAQMARDKDGVPGLFELYFLGRDSGGTRPARR